ncbi:CD63 antigen, partial [Stegodyphus mimosarum]
MPYRFRRKKFAVAIAVILFIQVLCGICVLFFTNTLGETLKSGVKESMETYDIGNRISVELNTLQSKFRCCGSTTYKSWFDTYWAEGKAEVPESCCVNLKQCHNRVPLMVEDIFQQGCNERITNVMGTMNVFVIFCIVSALVYQVLGIYLVIMVALRKKEVGGESVLPVL